MENQAVSKNLDENIMWWKQQFSNCADIKMLGMCLGKDMDVRAFLTYVEITGGSFMIEKSTLGNLLSGLNRLSGEEVLEKIRENGMGVSDAVPFATMSEAADAMLTGDTVIFVDGFDRAVKIPDKGYPAMTLQEVKSEKSIRGSNEAFSNSIKQNTALIRKRLQVSGCEGLGEEGRSADKDKCGYYVPGRSDLSGISGRNGAAAGPVYD